MFVSHLFRFALIRRSLSSSLTQHIIYSSLSPPYTLLLFPFSGNIVVVAAHAIEKTASTDPRAAQTEDFRKRHFFSGRVKRSSVMTALTRRTSRTGPALSFASC